MNRRSLRHFAHFVLILGLLGPTASARAGGDWNDAGMAWRGYEEGLAEAGKEDKPICLVFYTDWCPHCTKYSGVFHDPAVVEMSKKFVVIRVNKDENTVLSAKYAVDGEYIPRTYFLAPDGTLDGGIQEQRPNYKYFYDTSNPANLLRSMQEALAKHGGRKAS